MPTPDRCTLHRLSLNDPEQAAADPALAALLRDGWTVVSDIPIADPGNQHVLLFLAPPRKTETDRMSMAFSLLGVVLGAVGIGMCFAILTGAL